MWGKISKVLALLQNTCMALPVLSLSLSACHHRAMTTINISYIYTWVVLNASVTKPGSHYVCAVRTLLGVDWKHKFIRSVAEVSIQHFFHFISYINHDQECEQSSNNHLIYNSSLFILSNLTLLIMNYSLLIIFSCTNNNNNNFNNNLINNIANLL